MSNFKFKFQTLLSLKVQLEKSAQNDLGIALQILKREESKLFLMEENMDAYIENYRQKTSGKINTEEIRSLKKYMGFLGEEIDIQRNRVNLERANVDKLRVRLTEIMKEKKVLEKLKERALEKYFKEERKKEQMLVDEIVSFKYKGF